VCSLARCPHTLHCACLSGLIQSGALLCPVCRASLVPAALDHLLTSLVPAPRAGRAVPLAGDPHRLAAGFLPGVEARVGGTVTLADWEWNGELADEELGVRLGPETAAAIARHRLEMQRTSFGRQVCSRGSLTPPPVCPGLAHHVRIAVSLFITFAFLCLVAYFLVSTLLRK